MLFHKAEMGAGQYIHDSFGGIGGVILWGVILLIVGSMLYNRSCKKTISGSSTNRQHVSCKNCALPIPLTDQFSSHDPVPAPITHKTSC